MPLRTPVNRAFVGALSKETPCRYRAHPSSCSPGSDDKAPIHPATSLHATPCGPRNRRNKQRIYLLPIIPFHRTPPSRALEAFEARLRSRRSLLPVLGRLGRPPGPSVTTIPSRMSCSPAFFVRSLNLTGIKDKHTKSADLGAGCRDFL